MSTAGGNAGEPQKASLAAVLRAQAASLRAQADVLEAAAVSAEGAAPPASSGLLDLATIATRYGVRRDAIKAAIRRSEVVAHEGPRRKIMLEQGEVERWLRSKPYRPRRKPSDTADELAQWEADVSAQLESLAKRRH